MSSTMEGQSGYVDFCFQPQEAVVEKKHFMAICSILLVTIMATVMASCSAMQRSNPFSRSHGLPQQSELGEE